MEGYSLRCRGGSQPPHLPDSQFKSLVLKPRTPHPLPSAPDTPNSAKMAHLMPRNPAGGDTVGAWRGKGGALVPSPEASSVPSWHKTPSLLPLSISNCYTKYGTSCRG